MNTVSGTLSRLRATPIHVHLRWVRWMLPVVVLLMAGIHQMGLHYLVSFLPAVLHPEAELLIYGLTGSVVAWFGLSRIADSVAAQEQAENQLRTAYARLEASHSQLLTLQDFGRQISAAGNEQAVLELAAQANDEGLVIDRLVTATGSAGTHAGLVAGMAVSGADIPVLGIGVRAPKEKQETNVFNLAVETAALLGHPERVTREMVVADCDYVGAGYGLIDQAVVDALTLAARTEGLLLDPVYTGKAMKGLIALSKAGAFEGETVVFLHTGGAQGLFGYQGELDGML